MGSIINNLNLSNMKQLNTIDSKFARQNFTTIADVGRKQYKPVKALLSKGSTNAKTSKNELTTFILYLAPANTVPEFNLCPFASVGCIASCLNTAGRGAFSNVQLARINKTKFGDMIALIFIFNLLRNY